MFQNMNLLGLKIIKDGGVFQRPLVTSDYFKMGITTAPYDKTASLFNCRQKTTQHLF